jgi:hypothetical protein
MVFNATLIQLVGVCVLERMTESNGGLGPMWPPAMWTEMQEAGEEAVEQQQQMMQQLFTGSAGSMDMSSLGAMRQLATFKTRVQSGGRISIPDAEREALDIEEGDIVQAVVLPVKRNRDDTNE